MASSDFWRLQIYGVFRFLAFPDFWRLQIFGALRKIGKKVEIYIKEVNQQGEASSRLFSTLLNKR